MRKPFIQGDKAYERPGMTQMSHRAGERKRLLATVILALGLPALASWALVAADSASALSVSFTKIADTSTPIPGSSDTFTSFGFAPAIDGDAVVFKGFGASVQQGIYLDVAGNLAVVADTSTAIPGGSGTFTELLLPSIDGSDVAFLGHGTPFQRGIYTNIGGSLGVVANTNTVVPGTTCTFPPPASFFAVFLEPAIHNGAVGFRAFGACWAKQEQGIYSTVSGNLAVVADTSTSIPGGSGTFTNFGFSPSLDGGAVAFQGAGASGQTGIYLHDGGNLAVVADTDTSIPGGSGTFTGYGSYLSLDGGAVAFRGGGASEQGGIYTNVSGSLAVVADRNTAIPDGSGIFFKYFGSPSLDGGAVAFLGYGPLPSSQQGIYTNLGGTLNKVIAVGDILDGKSVYELFSHTQSLSGNRIAFFASLGDGSKGIFVATLHTEDDTDFDGIIDELDACPNTVIPEATVPSDQLGVNRFALIDDDGVFDTTAPNGKGPRRSFTIEDTAGCSCEQIIAHLDLGLGHAKFGCSISAMEDFINSLN